MIILGPGVDVCGRNPAPKTAETLVKKVSKKFTTESGEPITGITSWGCPEAAPTEAGRFVSTFCFRHFSTFFGHDFSNNRLFYFLEEWNFSPYYWLRQLMQQPKTSILRTRTIFLPETAPWKCPIPEKVPFCQQKRRTTHEKPYFLQNKTIFYQ